MSEVTPVIGPVRADACENTFEIAFHRSPPGTPCIVFVPQKLNIARFPSHRNREQVLQGYLARKKTPSPRNLQ